MIMPRGAGGYISGITVHMICNKRVKITMVASPIIIVIRQVIFGHISE